MKYALIVTAVVNEVEITNSTEQNIYPLSKNPALPAFEFQRRFYPYRSFLAKFSLLRVTWGFQCIILNYEARLCYSNKDILKLELTDRSCSEILVASQLEINRRLSVTNLSLEELFSKLYLIKAITFSLIISAT